MITAPHIVAAVLVLVGYSVLCLLKPTKRCGRCKATPGRSPRYAGVAGPSGKCRRCNGHKKHPRFGAGAVHWFIWAAIVDPIRERRAERPLDTTTPKFAQARDASRADPYAAARLRAQQRADSLLAFQARLRARTAATTWQYA